MTKDQFLIRSVIVSMVHGDCFHIKYWQGVLSQSPCVRSCYQMHRYSGGSPNLFVTGYLPTYYLLYFRVGEQGEEK